MPVAAKVGECGFHLALNLLNFNLKPKISVDLVPILNERAGFPQGTELMLYEEIKPNTVDRIMNITDPLEKVNNYFLLILKFLTKWFSFLRAWMS